MGKGAAGRDRERETGKVEGNREEFGARVAYIGREAMNEMITRGEHSRGERTGGWSHHGSGERDNKKKGEQ